MVQRIEENSEGESPPSDGTAFSRLEAAWSSDDGDDDENMPRAVVCRAEDTFFLSRAFLLVKNARRVYFCVMNNNGGFLSYNRNKMFE